MERTRKIWYLLQRNFWRPLWKFYFWKTGWVQHWVLPDFQRSLGISLKDKSSIVLQFTKQPVYKVFCTRYQQSSVYFTHLYKDWDIMTQPAITCSKWRRSGIFIVNFEHISRLVSIVNFEQVNAGWGRALWSRHIFDALARLEKIWSWSFCESLG